MLSLGIVGLPNVGKSTLFNALTKSRQANVQNYPFCTIESNVGVVEVPDDRLSKLSAISKSKKIIPTAIEFVDIAGLVKGASEGEGLGNKFLSHIREVDAIVQVVRAFKNNDIIHVHNRINPKDDADIINLELVLADLQSVSARLEKTKKQAKGINAKAFILELTLLEKLFSHLQSGKSVRSLEYTEEELQILKELHLLTMKPMMYVVNIDDSAGEEPVVDDNAVHLYVSAQMESEIATLSDKDAKEFMIELGMNRSGLDKIITAGYELLDLITYFTSGEPETRAWTVKRGTTGPNAAGVIHTDFIKGYIKADVANWKDFVEFNGWNGMKEKGKMQLVGKDYVVQNGDVCYFHVAT